jgi:hypothetical protein
MKTLLTCTILMPAFASQANADQIMLKTDHGAEDQDRKFKRRADGQWIMLERG